MSKSIVKAANQLLLSLYFLDIAIANLGMILAVSISHRTSCSYSTL